METTEELAYTVSKLIEGKKYSLRVAAQNEIGTGEFAEIPNVVPKCPFSKSLGVEI